MGTNFDKSDERIFPNSMMVSSGIVVVSIMGATSGDELRKTVKCFVTACVTGTTQVCPSQFLDVFELHGVVGLTSQIALVKNVANEMPIGGAVFCLNVG